MAEDARQKSRFHNPHRGEGGAASSRKPQGPAVFECSAGGVVVREIDGALEMAVIRPRGRTLWALPKGHLDPGECAEAAARREIMEETGLTTDLEAPLGDIRYSYTFRGKRIDKQVHFFLFRWNEGPDRGAIDALEPAMRVEVDEARWMPLLEAASRLAYAGERQVAARAVEMLKAAVSDD